MFFNKIIYEFNIYIYIYIIKTVQNHLIQKKKTVQNKSPLTILSSRIQVFNIDRMDVIISSNLDNKKDEYKDCNQFASLTKAPAMVPTCLKKDDKEVKRSNCDEAENR